MHSETPEGTSASGRDSTPDTRTDRGAEETRGAGVSGVEPPPESPPKADINGGDGPGATAPAAGDDSGAGGSQEGAGNSRAPESSLPADRGRNGLKRVTDRELEIALKMANGNVALAARALGLDASTVKKRIPRIPHLFALYGAQAPGHEVPVPNELSTMTRTPAEIPALIENSLRAEELMKQDRQMLRDGLSAAGITPGTIEKLRALDGLAKDSGALLSASLDYTHRLHIYAQAALFEEMIYIREHYLRDTNLDGMVQVFWQRAYNEIAELLGKGCDRTMASTQAMVAMMKAQGNGGGGSKTPKAKPGF